MADVQDDGDCQTIEIPVTVGQPNPFVGPSVEDDQPVSYPLDDLDAFLQWKANDPEDHGQLFSVASVPHTPKIVDEGSLKTLVCNDASYDVVKFVQGQTGKDTYYIQYLNMIDIFVYFTHHFVTIPPVSWVNAVHRNGVTMLGTFITEGDDGYERCKKIFASEKSWKRVADQLVAIAQFYRFDGWFLNIENNIDQNSIQNLISFVRYLTEKTHEMDSNGMVIWYDAVTCDGQLDWQNELNQNNQCFYDVCDGIFLNYAWTESMLETSKSIARSGSSVFVGVDVYGRYISSSGGFETYKAMATIQKCGLSSGLFATAWDYAKFGPTKFEESDKRFWKLLTPYCPSYPLLTNNVASCFNPGDNPDKWTFINAQDLMPDLPSSYLSVVAADDIRSGKLVVNIPKNISETDDLISIFKFEMNLKKDETAILILPVDCNACFVLQSNIGEIKPSSQSIHALPFNQKVKVNKYLADTKLQVQGLNIKVRVQDKGSNFTVDFLSCLLPVSNDIGMLQLSRLHIKCRCIDVYWKKCGTGKLCFNATIVFDNLPKEIASSKVLCSTYPSGLKKEGQILGSSFCDRFRVHDLVVPNPELDSSNPRILFTISHEINAGLKVCQSQLMVVYGSGNGKNLAVRTTMENNNSKSCHALKRFLLRCCESCSEDQTE